MLKFLGNHNSYKDGLKFSRQRNEFLCLITIFNIKLNQQLNSSKINTCEFSQINLTFWDSPTHFNYEITLPERQVKYNCQQLV